MKALLLVMILLLTSCSAQSISSSSSVVTTIESGDDMTNYDFSALTNVELINAELGSMTDEQLAVLYTQARYCQAMTMPTLTQCVNWFQRI